MPMFAPRGFYAVAKQFAYPNPLSMRPANPVRYPDLRPTPTGVGKISVAGTRAAVRTIIHYRDGILNDKGASLLDGYMEDLATDCIYRLMIPQRMPHAGAVKIGGEKGASVTHSADFITRVFDEELERILRELPPETDPSIARKNREARQISNGMIARGEFSPV